jgi:hypothetical protein
LRYFWATSNRDVFYKLTEKLSQKTNIVFLATEESNVLCTRQALLNVYLSPESVRACTIYFDCTDFKEDALKNKFLSDDSVCHISKAVASVCMEFSYPCSVPKFSQVCINSVDCVCKPVISL